MVDPAAAPEIRSRLRMARLFRMVARLVSAVSASSAVVVPVAASAVEAVVVAAVVLVVEAAAVAEAAAAARDRIAIFSLATGSIADAAISSRETRTTQLATPF